MTSRLSITVIVATFMASSALMSTSANAAKLSKKEQAIVAHVKATCKAKAAKDGNGLGFVERWRLYSDCIHEAAKQNSGIDFSEFN
jgi:hypothetical protein